jgi:uncharacterized membrane protein
MPARILTSVDLPEPILAEQRDDLAVADVEVDVTQRDERAEALRDVPQAEIPRPAGWRKRLAHVSRVPRASRRR